MGFIHLYQGYFTKIPRLYFGIIPLEYLGATFERLEENTCIYVD